jgi:hypothetical protein
LFDLITKYFVCRHVRGQEELGLRHKTWNVPFPTTSLESYE